MHFGQPLDDERFVALVRPNQQLRTMITADVYGASEERLGALLLIVGALTRLVALGLAVDVLVAIVSVKIRMAKAPFAGTPQVQGWEFEFCLLGGALALVFTGAGRLAVDAILGL